MEAADEEPVVRLARYAAPAAQGDGFDALRADVAAYSRLEPLGTLEGLAAASGVPVGALARYVLARWAAGGAEGLLELGASGVDHLTRLVDEAERAGTDAARLDAYDGMREVVAWLRAGRDAET